MTCLDEETVLAFLEGRLAAEAAGRVDEHLDTCAECRGVLAELARARLATARATNAKMPERSLEGEREGTEVGRYVLERQIGAGAAGVVYQAYDPQLRRKVALKLLAPPAPVSDAADDGHERLLREAHVLAALSHPNIISVHDAGIHSGRVYIVMELVDGPTLATWLQAAARPYRKVLAVFIEAARGLAAAHDAGVVHRDFKPDNVLVGRDGRVRVTDFGLARPVRVLEGEPADAPLAASTPGSVIVTTAAGTPLFMAPEQFLGTPASAQTDQFSFCVALHMALYGRHPFGGSAAELMRLATVPAARELEPPTGHIPARVHEVLRRGLHARPEERYPSLGEVVGDLEAALAPPAPQRRHVIAAIVAAAAAVGLLATGWARRQAPASRAQVAAEALCGNGRVEPGEECDDGNATDDDGCVPGCRRARCGDRHVRRGVEECDDGNAFEGDGCSASCLLCRAGNDRFVWPSTGHCYSRHDGALPWPEARAACERLGAHLITFTSTYESHALWTAFFRASRPATWIGLRRGVGDTFQWITGEAMPRNDWAPGEPQPDVGPCVLQTPKPALPQAAGLQPANSWATAACTRTLPFVCEQPLWAFRSATHHAYRLFTRPSTWAEAQADCAARGGHLATIADPDEQAFVAARTGLAFWIGATDARQEGAFEWVTGEPFAFAAFGPGEPDARVEEDDYALFGPDEVWHDRPAWQPYPYLCEIDR